MRGWARRAVREGKTRTEWERDERWRHLIGVGCQQRETKGRFRGTDEGESKAWRNRRQTHVAEREWKR